MHRRRMLPASGLFGLTWLVVAAFVLRRLWRGALRMAAAKIRPVMPVSATAVPAAPAMAKAVLATVLATVSLIVAVRAGILLWLATTACNERR